MNLRTSNIVRESCGECNKQIYIGQAALICSKCDIIFHATCLSDAVVFRQSTYCNLCVAKYDIIRYNPYFIDYEVNHDRFYESDVSNFADMFDSVSEILEN